MTFGGFPVEAPPPAPRRRRGLVLTLVAILVVGVVFAMLRIFKPSPGAEGPSTGDRPSASKLAVPSGSEALARYYTQTLDWQSCSGGECATVTVPIDYARPDGKTLAVAVLRVPARSGRPQGAIVVDPGGPGASGVDFAKRANSIVGRSVRDAFDIVGFDPRGVGRTAPIDCLDDAAMDLFLGGEPTPDTPGEEQEFLAGQKAFAQACVEKNPDLIAHVSTNEVAKDMDILRAALGQEKLSYLGASYGTFLGATYAGLFPARVGRMVLDGVVAPDLTSAQVGEGQARGFDGATRAYVENCVGRGSCPLGESVDEGMARLKSFLEQVDAAPLPVSGDARVKSLTEGWASMGIAVAMYDESSWPLLTTALKAAFAGDGTELQRLANYYAERRPDGTYTGNLLEVISAVNCLDRPDSADLGVVHANVEAFSKTAPLWGRFLAWGDVICGVWPVKGPSKPSVITAAGSDTIVVVGTTRDPATIYEWAQRLRSQLSNAVLLTYEGDGHTAYQRGSTCINDAIDTYFVTGTAPRDGLRCSAG